MERTTYLVYLRSISNRFLVCVLQQKKAPLAKVNDAEREMQSDGVDDGLFMC